VELGENIFGKIVVELRGKRPLVVRSTGKILNIDDLLHIGKMFEAHSNLLSRVA
jgi:hypothetical protein